MSLTRQSSGFTLDRDTARRRGVVIDRSVGRVQALTTMRSSLRRLDGEAAVTVVDQRPDVGTI